MSRIPDVLRSRRSARGSTPKGTMNKLEAAFNQRLLLLRAAGEVLDFGYGRVTFKLAPRTTYTPDFDVTLKDLSVLYVETKGFLEEDANVKFKTVSAMFPYLPFVMLKRKGKGFEVMKASPNAPDVGLLL